MKRETRILCEGTSSSSAFKKAIQLSAIQSLSESEKKYLDKIMMLKVEVIDAQKTTNEWKKILEALEKKLQILNDSKKKVEKELAEISRSI
ncbi:hypothetical protein WA026_012579 [Henosepilachna vigintioctopunctata]|uniref:Uncharacterized protein n=1 Tax=Henosepilachna vigintioctopunctata TaxID=420089 RepID=A0AAW1TXH0_9CUCU